MAELEQSRAYLKDSGLYRYTTQRYTTHTRREKGEGRGRERERQTGNRSERLWTITSTVPL